MSCHHIKVTSDDPKLAINTRCALMGHLNVRNVKGYRYAGIDPENKACFAAMADTKKSLAAACKKFDCPDGCSIGVSTTADAFADLEAEDEAAAVINKAAIAAAKAVEVAGLKVELEEAEVELDDIVATLVEDEIAADENPED